MIKKLPLAFYALLMLTGIVRAEQIPILVKTTSPDLTTRCLNQWHIPVQSKAGDIWSVYVEKTKIPLLNKEAGISSIQLPVGGFTPKSDDSTRRLVRVKQVHEGLGLPQAYTGTGVIVGIIDIGFDYTHPAFRTNNGSLRIARVWEQQQNGQAPAGYNYGNELKNTTEILGKQKDLTSATHGTFVAGIAAGSHIGANAGIAPDANLVLVSLNYGKDDYYSDYEIAPASILDGIKYVFDYAKSQNKPAVVNISWGHHCGPHDGTTLLDQGISNLTGPGHMVVVAAGNEGNTPLHLGAFFSTADTVFTRQTFPEWVYTELSNKKKPEHGMIDFWGPTNSDFSVQWQWVDNDMKTVARTPFFSASENRIIDTLMVLGTDTLSYKIEAEKANTNNNKPHILFRFRNNAYDHYQLILAIRSNGGGVHAWNCGGDWKYGNGMFLSWYRNNSYIKKGLQGNTTCTIGESGANCPSVITVGAYNANLDWYTNTGSLLDLSSSSIQEGALAPFSSRGPTANGNLKPDIVAPGYYIAGPINHYATEQPPSYTVTANVVSESTLYNYAMETGTSFAAPVVTGTVALMLQIKPDLTVGQIKQLLTNTALTDTFTNAPGGVPNTSFGAGKLNVLSAITRLLNVTGLDKPESSQPLTYPNPFNDELHINSALPVHSIEVFNMQGKQVLSQHYALPLSDFTIKTADLPEGFYIATVKSANHTFALKLSCIH